MANKIRTIHYGLGPIGCHIARVAARRSQIAIVGGVDIDPAKVGQDLGMVIGLEKPLGLPVERDLAAVLKRTPADVVVHSTGSFLPQVRDQIEALVQAGLNVVSTCEELSYPWAAHPRIAADLDRLAKDKGVTILGTGVNPGFVMDTLALVLSGVCQDITHLCITRVVDTAKRRVQLQRKTGAGLPLDDFHRRVKAGTLRHVGLPESLHMVAAGLGWKLDEVEDTIEPIVASAPARSADIVVEPGQAAGVRQVARGLQGGREVIALHLVMQLGAAESYDAVDIEGTPPVHLRIAGGVHGDQATAAIVVNAIPRVVAADPGLLTMADLPVVAAWLG
jgi:4-hydroxy-tetrahydrodipicolinate reductase